MKNKNIRAITRTAALIALLISLQWATAGTQAFAGQYITGTLVNCVLAIAATFGGVLCGIVVAILSPFFAFLLGIGPKLIQIVPCIALGNLAYVLLLGCLLNRVAKQFWEQTVSVILASAAKFAVLYLAVVKIMIPVMADTLKPPQIQTFTLMFSWPQLVTALLGGTLALLILPILRKAINK